MIKSLKTLALAVTVWSAATAAFATGAGFYVGAAAGGTNTHNVVRPVQTNTVPPSTVDIKPSNTGVGGRIFAGYGINEYMAVEGGFIHFGPSTYSGSNLASCGNPTLRENGFDLVGKATYPFSNFGIYGKAGAAFVRTSLAGSMSPPDTLNTCGNSNSTTVYARPTASIGASYDLTPNWVADVSFTRVFKSSSNFQNADFIALGLSYHFVDKYCGQFLC